MWIYFVFFLNNILSIISTLVNGYFIEKDQLPDFILPNYDIIALILVYFPLWKVLSSHARAAN